MSSELMMARMEHTTHLRTSGWHIGSVIEALPHQVSADIADRVRFTALLELLMGAMYSFA
jgi:hypothetical protein